MQIERTENENHKVTTYLPKGEIKAVVAIFIGHSVEDGGAYSPWMELNEYAYNNEPAYNLGVGLANIGYKALVYDRVVAGWKGWQPMCDDLNQQCADLHLMLHFNCYNGRARGTETLYFYASKKGYKAARIFCNHIYKHFNTHKRGAKPLTYGERAYALVAKPKAVSVILEAAFGDNKADAQALIEGRPTYHDALITATKEYFGDES